MANWSNEAEAREQIKALVAEYYHDFKEKKADFKPGDRVTYASRVFDEKEMCALTDATLDFWLTTGRFADEFEKEFAKWIGRKVRQPGQLRLLRQPDCLYGAHRPGTGRPPDQKGR